MSSVIKVMDMMATTDELLLVHDKPNSAVGISLKVIRRELRKLPLALAAEENHAGNQIEALWAGTGVKWGSE